jgi:hypothetical protein
MRYYLLTGDSSLVAQVYPAMKRVADYIDAAVVTPQGLVYDLPGGSGPYTHGIIDWPADMRYDTVVDGNGAELVVNALAVGANRAVADAAGLLGSAGDTTAYGHQADVLGAAVNAQLRNSTTGLYSDGLATDTLARIENYSEHAQTYAIDYGIAPASSYPTLGAYIAGQGMKQGPMDLRQLEAALGATGRTDALVALLTDPTSDGPAKVLAEGGTFMWEQWDPGCTVAGCTGTAVDQTSNESFSHGWGSAGVSGILQSLLGITVTGSGASTVQIAPPASGLARASGTEWTERGPVTVAWHRTGHGFAAHISVPDNVTATVVLPKPAGGHAVFHIGSGTTDCATSGCLRAAEVAQSGAQR